MLGFFLEQRGTERRIIGCRLVHGPWGLLGLGSGRRCPSLISLGYSPVSAAVFSISAICSWTIGGATFISSAGGLSWPVLLLFLNLLAHLTTSTAVKGVVNLVGFISMKGTTFSTVKRDSKNFVIICVFCSGSVTISPSSLSTTTLIFSFLLRFLIAS